MPWEIKMKRLISGCALYVAFITLILFNTEPQTGIGQSPNRDLPYAFQYDDATKQIEAIRCIAYEIDALRKEIVELRKVLTPVKKETKGDPLYNPTVKEMEEWGMFPEDHLLGNG